jgi:L-threonylcarbamoyladenylate synthase
MGAGDVASAVAALRAGLPVLLPADGVYGLCCSPERAESVRGMYALKGRAAAQPTAIIAASIEQLLERVPELRGMSERIVRALLPGPYTLVLPNPGRRYPWLVGDRPETIGIRVAVLPADTQLVLDGVGAVAATSANEAGGPSPASLAEVPERVRAGCGAELDAGTLPGTASTVIDFTGREAVVLREGAGPSAEAIATAERVLIA